MKKFFGFVLIMLLISTPILAESASSSIKGTAPDSELYGSASFKDTDAGLAIDVEVFGAPAGLHGIHIHELGNCADSGNAAGSHYNPDGTQHGLLSKDGFEKAHAGDFGNIEIGGDGHGTLRLVIGGLTVKGETRSVQGRAVILHEKQDDFGQPTGNAGSRIACGVIELGK